MSETTATIFDIERSSYVDGPGIRTTVFFKGCNLRCAWCHNPESQSPTAQMMFYKSKCVGCGKCREVCPGGGEDCVLCGQCVQRCSRNAREICGKPMDVEQVWNEIRKDRLFYDASGGGVTFSGGECMLQIDFLEKILALCRNNGIHTAIDTAGHVPYGTFERILPYTDLILYDVKCIDDGRHMAYTGVSNERILDNLRRLLGQTVPVWIRIPVIGGVNDRVEEMQEIKEFLNGCGAPEKIELLPYHAMGEHKYDAIGKEAPVFHVPDAETLARLKQLFS